MRQITRISIDTFLLDSENVSIHLMQDNSIRLFNFQVHVNVYHHYSPMLYKVLNELEIITEFVGPIAFMFDLPIMRIISTIKDAIWLVKNAMLNIDLQIEGKTYAIQTAKLS